MSDSRGDDALKTPSGREALASMKDELRQQFSRTPRPYLLSPEGLEISKDYDHAGQHAAVRDSNSAAPQQETSEDVGTTTGAETKHRESRQVSVAGSESGTEADDERPSFVKALPPSSLQPRKGLKTGEKDAFTLLTPSQLDEKEQGYFARDNVVRQRRASVHEREQEQRDREQLRRRRFAEFVRRTSEVALMGVILLCVLCGDGVGQIAWQWRKELLAQIVTIAILILAYPIKLSIVDTRAAHARVWERFRVPASFDPATVLYPPLLPVLVALSVAPANPAVVLPNIILGLASLPQRLFPRSSRLGKLNSMHWLIAIIPLIVSENTDWPSQTRLSIPYSLKTPNGLSSETLVSLYPLHHALMAPLHYLTSTSLLISELHLLSAVLINLLLLAASPQAVILKACLWIGGVSLLVCCGLVLHWNITLARVPKWKLRRPGHTAEERKSLVDAVSDLVNLQRAAGAFTSTTTGDSDADEDELSYETLKRKPEKPLANGMPKLNTAGLIMPSFNMHLFGPQSALEPRQLGYGYLSNADEPPKTRPRRNTVPEREPPEVPERKPSTKKKVKSNRLLWCLQLTPEQAQRRKWLYAGFAYLAIVVIVILPVRLYVSKRALHNIEPVGWALGYLLGQTSFVRTIICDFGSWSPPPLPTSTGEWTFAFFDIPPYVDLIRDDLGEANVRLLLIAYWILVLMVGLLTVFSLTAFVEVDTRRKVFHGVMVAMLLPSTFIDPCYCALALAIMLAIFLLLEVIRAGQVPPLGNAIGRFVAPYVDGRDLRGPVVVSHIFLLIGCAVPLWFSLASIDRAGKWPWQGWELASGRREVAMLAGVVCVGMGDAAASLIGRRYGRHKWIWVGGKSLEGSAAFAVAVALGLMAARFWEEFGGWADRNWSLLGWALVFVRAVFCACGASFMEAVLTGANDNVVVPVALWLLVKGCRL